MILVMVDKMEGEYKEYLKLRNTKNPDEESKRIKIKADLAEMVSKGEGKWYNDRLKGRGYGFGTSYGDVAEQLSDRNPVFEADRKEPSFAESVLATKDLKEDYNQYAEKLLPHVRTIIKIGSSTWAENFDVRGDLTNPSDLDMEVLVDPKTLNPDDFDNIGDPKDPHALKEALIKFLRFYNLDEDDPNKADYLSFGFKRGNRPVSIHFTPTPVFERICTVDYFTDIKEHRLREYRVSKKSKDPVYTQRDGHGNLYKFGCEVKILDNDQGRITKTPLMMVGDREHLEPGQTLVGGEGQLVLGLVMDKYFCRPALEGDAEFFIKNINEFKKGLAKYDKIHGGSFSKYPSRSHRMPHQLLEWLDEQEQEKKYV